MSRTSIVTGAAGFIGSHLLEALLERGDTVVGLDNLSNGKLSNIEPILQKYADRCTFIEGDIRDEAICNRVVEGADIVFHQAALGSVPRSMKEPALYHNNNVTGTLNMLDAARKTGLKRFIFASSSSVYGDTPTLPKVETMPANCKSPYAQGKYMTEQYASLYHRVYGLETVAFRYFNVFGPRQAPDSQYAAAIPKFVTSLLQNKPPTIFGDGEQTRDFTYIQNVVNANLSAAEVSNPDIFGKAYNVGCGGRISLNNLIATIKQITGATVDPIYTDPRLGDVRDSQADIQKFQAAFGDVGTINLESGLKETVPYYS